MMVLRTSHKRQTPNPLACGLRAALLAASTFLGLSAPSVLAALPVGKVPPTVKLTKLDDGPWSSESLRGKIHLLVYSNVDARDLNAEAADAIKAQAFPRDRFASVAVINMKGSWQPNFMIDRALSEKQKEFPDTLYIKDMNHTLVNQWKLKDKSNDFVLLDRDGSVLFSVDDKLNKEQLAGLLDTIKAKLAEPLAPAATPAATPAAPTPAAAEPTTKG